MPHPLELSYNWRTPALFASIAATICVGALARGQAPGWLSALIVVVALWVLIVALIYLRTRAYLLVDGSRPRLLPEFKRRIEVHVRGVERNGLPEHAEHRRFDSILAMINHVDGCIAFAGSVEADYADRIARRWAEVLVARGNPRPGA